MSTWDNNAIFLERQQLPNTHILSFHYFPLYFQSKNSRQTFFILLILFPYQLSPTVISLLYAIWVFSCFDCFLLYLLSTNSKQTLLFLYSFSPFSTPIISHSNLNAVCNLSIQYHSVVSIVFPLHFLSANPEQTIFFSILSITSQYLSSSTTLNPI